MTSEQFIKFREMIEREYSDAVTKHPKFADEFTACNIGQAMAGELMFKTVNSTAPYQADMLLQEEMWEATTAYIGRQGALLAGTRTVRGRYPANDGVRGG